MPKTTSPQQPVKPAQPAHATGATTQFEKDKRSENRGDGTTDSQQDSDQRAKPGSAANPPEKSGAGTLQGRVG